MQTGILIGLFICHWLADYTPLSNSWMLDAKRFGRPLYPIFTHAFIHSVLMLIVLSLVFGLDGIRLAALFNMQLFSHFAIDVWKGRMNGWFPVLQSPANKWHWVVFGYDQLLHALVIVAMSIYAVS